MSKHTTDLKAKWQQAEQTAQKLMADKDQALDKIRAKYTARLQKANNDAAAAQKVYLDAEAVDALLNDPNRTDAEREAVAQRIGLELPG